MPLLIELHETQSAAGTVLLATPHLLARVLSLRPSLMGGNAEKAVKREYGKTTFAWLQRVSRSVFHGSRVSTLDSH